jgi:predicted AAA+ superfamily ATPase
MGEIAENPLKFIIFVDDLSFACDDDGFGALKAALEGSASAKASNAVIYATSNRRHLVKESMEARMGSDLHLNDTLQETMSLSARFGLTITFSKPEKDLYLEIVRSLAEEYGVTLEEAELYRKAEAFAIRANGRSPRTAKQFIQLICSGLK